MIKGTREHVVGNFPISTDVFRKKREAAYKTLYEGTGKGAEMRGWLDWPKQYFVSDEYNRLKVTAAEIRDKSDIVIVIGIGGSYLTPEAIIRSEYGEFYNEIAEKGKVFPRIYFAGNDLSSDKLDLIMTAIDGKRWSIIYISKSGGTAEPAVAFRTLWKILYEKYGYAANERVYAVTDASKGILKGITDKHKWESFVIPDDIGGRYSGFTACGLLPLAVAGIDTDKMLKGAIDAANDCLNNPDSFAGRYAEYRYSQYDDGYSVEFFAANTPFLSHFIEWTKQLFGESEGKEGKGLFPTGGIFPTDLHSLGQYLQEGKKGLIIETFLIREFKTNHKIPESNLEDNLDKRANRGFNQACAAAMDGAYNAHVEGGNPCCEIKLGPSLDDLTYLMYMMFVACATSAYMLDINPFDQPGVEKHKKIMQNSPKWDEFDDEDVA